MKYIIIWSAISFTLCVGCDCAYIKEHDVSMVTYPFSDPDPVASPSKAIYPYFRFDGYTVQEKTCEWKMVELENSYIKVSVAPDIGGKIWGAIEKQSGESFIYYNDVVKFRDIAMRGAWTSGGIEINFGIIGHAPWTATPVEYTFKRKEDGSVSCYVGTLDLLTRAWWCTEINLEKDKAYFTTSTRWYNPSFVAAPYYHWMNAGYTMTPGMEFHFPGNAYIGHDGDSHRWPLDENNHNLSRYSENDFGSAKSYHIVGKNTDYYATYSPEKDFGSVHHADFDDKPGMKIFLWGLSREGMIWENILTDHSGQYVELQSGKLFNQESHSSADTPFKHYALAAGSEESFTEYWYPVKGTKGVLTTNKIATINLITKKGQTQIYISPLQHFNDSLIIRENNRTLYARKINLNPLSTFTDTFEGTTTNPDIRLGKEIHHASLQNATARPLKIKSDFDANSLYGRYINATQKINIRNYKDGRFILEQLLKEDPSFIPALSALSRLDYIEGSYKSAQDKALQVLAINTYDGNANMIYGAASIMLNQINDAINGFSIASKSPHFRQAAYLGLAKSYASLKDWNRVLCYTRKMVNSGESQIEALLLEAVAYRKSGRQQEARETLKRLEELMPIHPTIKFESYLLNDISAPEFIAAVRSELPHEIFQEIGLWYESAGDYEDAYALYSTIPAHPINIARKAYLEYKEGKDFMKTITEMESLSPEFVFPSRAEDRELYNWLDSVSNNWKSTYYRALLSVRFGDEAEALNLMNSLGNIPDYAPFYITRSELKSGQDKINDLLLSEKIDRNWRIGYKLIQEYKKQGNTTAMFETATTYRKLYGNDYRLGMAYIPVLMDKGNYEDAISYLEQTTIIPYEGAIEGRSMYRDCYLNMCIESMMKKDYNQAIRHIDKSALWIENLGVGKPYDEDIDTRTEDYLKAYCLMKKGQTDESEILWKKICDSPQRMNSNTILSLLALRHTGETQKAQELLEQYLQINNNPHIACWTDAVYKGDYKNADLIIQNKDLKSQTGPFGANSFKDYDFINIVQKIISCGFIL